MVKLSETELKRLVKGGETMDVILRAARQVIKTELVLDPPEPEVYVLA